MITHQMAMETEDMRNSLLSETRCECIFFFHCHECAGAMRVTREERQCFLSPYVSEPVTSLRLGPVEICTGIPSNTCS
jgi:hypothetical protein